MWLRKEAITMSLGAEGKSLIDLLNTYNITNNTVRKIIKAVENGMMRLGRLYKLEIVQKNPAVVIGNLVSNVMLEMLKGRHNYMEVIQTMFRNMREVYKINTLQKKYSELRVKRRASNNKVTQDLLGFEMDKVQKQIQKSPINYMIEEGFNDNFVEDINVKESMYMNKFDKEVYKFSEKHPLLRKAFDIAYINKGTVLNKWINNGFILADIAAQITSDQLDKKYMEKDMRTEFTAFFNTALKAGKATKTERALLYRKFKAKWLKNYKNNRKRYLAEMTIMYSVISGGSIATYLDKVNIDPFYRFKVRIKRVLLQRLKDRGMISRVMLAVEEVFSRNVMNIELAQDSMFDLMSGVSLQPFTNGFEGLSPAIVDILTGESI